MKRFKVILKMILLTGILALMFCIAAAASEPEKEDAATALTLAQKLAPRDDSYNKSKITIVDDTVFLTDDLTVTSDIILFGAEDADPVKLDLNGFMIRFVGGSSDNKGFILCDDISLVITGEGSIVTSGIYPAIDIYGENVSLMLDGPAIINGHIVGNTGALSSGAAINVGVLSENIDIRVLKGIVEGALGILLSSATSHLTIENGSVIGHDSAGIITTAGSKITMNAGSVEGASYGIYVSVDDILKMQGIFIVDEHTSLLTITGGDVTGKNAGIYLSGVTGTIDEGASVSGDYGALLIGSNDVPKTYLISPASSLSGAAADIGTNGSEFSDAVSFQILDTDEPSHSAHVISDLFQPEEDEDESDISTMLFPEGKGPIVLKLSDDTSGAYDEAPYTLIDEAGRLDTSSSTSVKDGADETSDSSFVSVLLFCTTICFVIVALITLFVAYRGVFTNKKSGDKKEN